MDEEDIIPARLIFSRRMLISHKHSLIIVSRVPMRVRESEPRAVNENYLAARGGKAYRRGLCDPPRWCVVEVFRFEFGGKIIASGVAGHPREENPPGGISSSIERRLLSCRPSVKPIRVYCCL